MSGFQKEFNRKALTRKAFSGFHNAHSSCVSETQALISPPRALLDCFNRPPSRTEQPGKLPGAFPGNWLRFPIRGAARRMVKSRMPAVPRVMNSTNPSGHRVLGSGSQVPVQLRHKDTSFCTDQRHPLDGACIVHVQAIELFYRRQLATGFELLFLRNMPFTHS